MGVKISELNEATSPQNSDVIPIVQNEETKKISVETLGIANIDTKINNVQVLQLNLVPNEEYIYSKDFMSWGIRKGKLVYIVVDFAWKKVFENSDNTTVFISGFPTNLATSPYVYPTDAISGHRYRMRIDEGNLLNWWANTNDINYGDSANRSQRLEILGYLQD